MPLKVELIATGPDLAAKDLEQLAERTRDARPAMRSILGQMLAAERDQFATSGGHAGGHWPEDAPATVDRKRAAGQDTRPERRTRALEEALTGGGIPGQMSLKGLTGPKGEAIRRFSKQQATLGTQLYYARFQKRFGRPLLQFTLRDFESWENTIVGWMMEGRA